MKKKYLVTSALPYANGPLHFGHIAGVYLPADIYTRHRKLQGHEVIHISGSDEHGVAITQNAQKANMPYQAYVNEWHAQHKKLLADYQIDFSFFGQTSSEYHKKETLKWFDKMLQKNAFEKRDEEQLQCQTCFHFLPDRYVEGECYVCGYKEARGDECPDCGTWIDPLKLINPVCKFCGSQNIDVKKSAQWYLVLSKFFDQFQTWFHTKTHWKKTVYPYVESLAKDSLHDRAITRDIDWGIDVPLPEAKGKKFYVWFDAPIGYVSNTKEYLRSINSLQDYATDWWLNPEVEITNFIGKDNIIFHAIIFPMMSIISGLARPVDELPANQYVNLFGKQFSKSKDWYVDSKEALTTFGVDALRFYLISLIPEMSDTSFTWTGMEAKVNNELANNVGNLVSRCLKFMQKSWPSGIDHKVAHHFWQTDDAVWCKEQLTEFHQAMDQFEFRRALDIVMNISARANLYFSNCAPWQQIKTDASAAQQTIAHTVHFIILISVYLSPFLPSLAQDLQSHFAHLLTPAMLAHIYQQDWAAWEKFIAHQDLTIEKEPGVLVPKIEKKVLADLEQSFLTKMKGKN